MGLYSNLKKAAEMDVEAPLSKAVPAIGDKDACVIVTRDGAYEGVVNDRSLENVTSDPSTTKLANVFERAPVLDMGMDAVEVARQFFTGSFRSLPVSDGRRVAGVLTRSAVIRELVAQGLVSGKVRDFMTSPAVTIEQGATLSKARSMMRDYHVRRLVAMDPSGKMTGILSTYDFKPRTLTPKDRLPFSREKHSAEDAPVSSLMIEREEVGTIGPAAELREAAKLMLEKDVSSLVVEKAGKPLGIISARDVLESVIYEEKTPVYLSGLGWEEKLVVEDILGEVDKELERIGRSIPLDYLSMHVKRYGHKYSIHARLKTRNAGILSASNHGFELQGAVHGIMSELKKMTLGKLKGNPLHERKRGRKGGEELAD